MSHVETYCQLVEELMEARRDARGRLSPTREASFAARLDEVWWKLTPAERDLFDAHKPGGRL